MAGSWLPLLVAGGLFRPSLTSRDVTGRFSKFKRHSIPLNVIYISKMKNSKNINSWVARGENRQISETFWTVYHGQISEPILTQLCRSIENEPKIHMVPKNSAFRKIIRGYRSLSLSGTRKHNKCFFFVGNVSKRGWQWFCYATVTCYRITKIILVMHRRCQGSNVGR